MRGQCGRPRAGRGDVPVHTSSPRCDLARRLRGDATTRSAGPKRTDEAISRDEPQRSPCCFFRLGRTGGSVCKPRVLITSSTADASLGKLQSADPPGTLKQPTEQTLFWLWTKIGRGEHANFQAHCAYLQKSAKTGCPVDCSLSPTSTRCARTCASRSARRAAKR